MLIRALILSLVLANASRAAGSKEVLEQLDLQRGIVCLIGLPEAGPGFILDLAKESELTFYAHRSGKSRALAAAAESEGLLGERIFVNIEPEGRIPLADNVADAVWVFSGKVAKAELLRVLRPRGTVHQDGRTTVKQEPEGYDDWSHPFHGPDNNPQSGDTVAKGRFRTQFIARPKFSPMPEQTVIAGGRMYKAMGHIAHKANQNAMLNTLICVNAYNGTILWKRPLPEGFMIHRNTMVATEDALYLGDHESCKVIDGKTGKVREEITIPAELTDGPVWKWMAIRDGTLYALVGNQEVLVETQKSVRRGLGHWPWGMWKGHEYGDARTSFGFGRTLVAYDLKTKKLRWHHRDPDFLDARALCMNETTIFAHAPEKFTLALSRRDGQVAWKSTDAEVFRALGKNAKAQKWVTGYATTPYLKCNADYLFFAGPVRETMVVAHAKDGSLAWTFDTGNVQLVLRKDAVYAAGPKNGKGYKLDYRSGDVLAEFPGRRACTRATGNADSIFYRASGGTVRVLTENNRVQHIAPMRPPCQDGVLVSNGHLYWGPWMCGCQLSLYGNIGLAPHPEYPTESESNWSRHAELGDEAFAVRDGDWPQYRGGPARDDRSASPLPVLVNEAWNFPASQGELPTAPVAGGGLVFTASRAGVVTAVDAEIGSLAWKAYTGGPVYYPPALSGRRLLVGSADGQLYAYEAATGKLLWTVRPGPVAQLIPVFGKLQSTWPLAGGVVVEDETVYLAAGITHYDGIRVMALDARTGEIQAWNFDSGRLNAEMDSGISMQGVPRIVDGELRFLGGGRHEYARYRLEDLACLNSPRDQPSSQWRTAFYPYYPDYGKFASLDHRCEDGRGLSHAANYEGLYFSPLALHDAPPPGAEQLHKDAAGEFIRRQANRRGKNSKKPQATLRWKADEQQRYNAFIVSDDQLLVAAHPDLQPEAAYLALLEIADGREIWRTPLPAPAVKSGLALDADGRIFVTLENGQLLGFEAGE